MLIHRVLSNKHIAEFGFDETGRVVAKPRAVAELSVAAGLARSASPPMSHSPCTRGVRPEGPSTPQSVVQSAGFAGMARAGIEPATPRFSVVYGLKRAHKGG